jgi:thioredoxin-related protein|tara:strand:+ start:676 stop:1167 length:492 start_codon:yes stop_codon:yes gene_type:complete
MKKLLLILACLPMIGFGQSLSKDTSIKWLTLNEAETLSAKYNKDILLFFYRENCDFCEKMKSQTFSDSAVINLINDNFFPVMINGKSKYPIIYNKKKFINEKPNAEDESHFHNLFKALVEMKDGNYYWPTIVMINSEHKKIIQGSGFWPKEQTLRNLKQILSN